MGDETSTDGKKNKTAAYVAIGCGVAVLGACVLCGPGYALMAFGMGDIFDELGMSTPAVEMPVMPAPPPAYLPDGGLAAGPYLPPPSGPIGPASVTAQTVIRFTVTRAEGLASMIPIGTECQIPVTREGTSCTARVDCWGMRLYGGDAGGVFPCTLNGPQVTGDDSEPTPFDGDGRIHIDTTSQVARFDDETDGVSTFVVEGTTLLP